MPTKIDHVLIAVRFLDQAIPDFNELGLNAAPGGTHTHGRSKNGLVPFHDETYLELIAPTEPDNLDEIWSREVGTGDGFIQFAVFSPDVEHEAHHLRAHGLEVSPIDDGGRTRPDGKETKWQIIRVTAPDGVALPFIIGDVTPRNLRVPEGDAAVHKNGLTRVLGLTSVVSDLDATANLYQQLFHDAGREVTPSVKGAAKALRFTLGTQWLELAVPAPGTDLQAYLDLRGPRPYEVVLGAAPSPSRGELQNVEFSHGARLRFVTGRR